MIGRKVDESESEVRSRRLPSLVEAATVAHDASLHH